MEIRPEDIERAKRELDHHNETVRRLKRNDARVKVTEKLAAKDYRDVLEMVSDYEIEIPNDHLERAADSYSTSDDSSKLRHAHDAYTKLGMQAKAQSLVGKI